MGVEDAEEQVVHVAGGSAIRPSMRGHRVLEMDAIGWIIFVCILVIMIPLLPFLVVLVIFLRLFGLTGERPWSWS